MERVQQFSAKDGPSVGHILVKQLMLHVCLVSNIIAALDIAM